MDELTNAIHKLIMRQPEVDGVRTATVAGFTFREYGDSGYGTSDPSLSTLDTRDKANAFVDELLKQLAA